MSFAFSYALRSWSRALEAPLGGLTACLVLGAVSVSEPETDGSCFFPQDANMRSKAMNAANFRITGY